MKRILWALPVAAAWVLFCVPAWAGDAAPAGANLADQLAKHWIVTLFAGIIPVLRTFFSDDTIKLPVWAAKKRVLLISILGFVATALEQLKDGLDWKSALFGFAVAAVPSLLQELLKWIAGAEPKSGATTPTETGMARPEGIRPPPGELRLSVYVPAVLLIALIALTGCAWLKPACAGIDLADSLCDWVVVKLPDGTTERVRRDDIMGVVKEARASRLSAAAKASVDAGADQ